MLVRRNQPKYKYRLRMINLALRHDTLILDYASFISTFFCWQLFFALFLAQLSLKCSSTFFVGYWRSKSALTHHTAHTLSFPLFIARVKRRLFSRCSSLRQYLRHHHHTLTWTCIGLNMLRCSHFLQPSQNEANAWNVISEACTLWYSHHQYHCNVNLSARALQFIAFYTEMKYYRICTWMHA